MLRWDESAAAALTEQRKQGEQAEWSIRYPSCPHRGSSAYELCMRQLLPRGLKYEPASTGVQATDGSWQALEAPHVEQLDAEQLHHILEAAVP